MEFSNDGDVEGWVASPNLPGLTATAGALVGTSTGVDPYITRAGLFFQGGASGQAGASNVLLRIRSTGGSAGQLWWTTTNTSNLAAERRVDFTYTAIPHGNYEDTDSDADGMSDAWELVNSFNFKLASDAVLDADGDGLTNVFEYLAGTAPRNSSDRFTTTRTGAALN